MSEDGRRGAVLPLASSPLKKGELALMCVCHAGCWAASEFLSKGATRLVRVKSVAVATRCWGSR